MRRTHSSTVRVANRAARIGSRISRLAIRSPLVRNRGSSTSSGVSTTPQKSAQPLATPVPTIVCQPSLASNAWYGANRALLEPSGPGTCPVAQ